MTTTKLDSLADNMTLSYVIGNIVEAQRYLKEINSLFDKGEKANFSKYTWTIYHEINATTY